jgi:hypothetical protein
MSTRNHKTLISGVAVLGVVVGPAYAQDANRGSTNRVADAERSETPAAKFFFFKKGGKDPQNGALL